MRVGFVICLRVIRQQTEGIQIGGNSFQHADHPRPVKTHELRLGLGIWPQIDDNDFATLQPLQPINAAAQHHHFSCQAGSGLGFQLGPFDFFLFTGTCV